MGRGTAEPSEDPGASPGANLVPDENKTMLILVVDRDSDAVELLASIGRKAGHPSKIIGAAQRQQSGSASSTLRRHRSSLRTG